MIIVKIIFIPISICIWIFFLGIAGFRGGFLYLSIVILNTVFFIILYCLLIKKTIPRLLLITISIGCSLLLGISYERYLLYEKLNSFDLNKDGIFNKFEETEEQRVYFKRVINDTNIFLKYVIVFPYALVVSILGTILFAFITFLFRCKLKCGRN